MIQLIGEDDALALMERVSGPLLANKPLLIDCFERLFRITPPSAPGAFFIGAEVRPSGRHWREAGTRVSVAGLGFSEDEAFAKCIGEAIEILSQFEEPAVHAAIRADDLREVPGLGVLFEDRARGGLFPALRLASGEKVAVPRGLCLRPLRASAYGRPVAPLGLGAGAGEAFDAAVLQGLLELIERDAAALWWYGGRRARRLQLSSLDIDDILGQMKVARGRAASRPLILLQLESEFSVPVIAAVSSGPQDRGFACGLSARPSMSLAIRSAVLEMVQMELAQEVALAKAQEGGISALNATDLIHLQKRLGPPPISLPQIDRANQFGDAPSDALAGLPPQTLVHQLARTMKGAGIDLYAIDLSRPEFGLATARVISPQLQSEPGSRSTPRLAQAIADTQFRSRMPLI